MVPVMKPEELDERVLRWTIHDITAPNLFKKKVSAMLLYLVPSCCIHSIPKNLDAHHSTRSLSDPKLMQM